MRVPLAGGERSSHALWLRVSQEHYKQLQQQTSTGDSRRHSLEVALVVYYRTAPTGEPRVLVHRFELELLPSLQLHALVNRAPLPSAADASLSSSGAHSLLPPDNDLRIQLQLTNPHPENFVVTVRIF